MPDTAVGPRRHARTAGSPVLVQRPGLRRDSPTGRRYRLLDMPGLGERQAAIVAGVAVGLSNREIGRALNLSEQTIKNTLSEILRRVGAKNREQLAALALGRGWVRFG